MVLLCIPNLLSCGICRPRFSGLALHSYIFQQQKFYVGSRIQEVFAGLVKQELDYCLRTGTHGLNEELGGIEVRMQIRVCFVWC